ncbi:MAG TPA: arginine decarboxylase [Firmicutes bacterium]|nr:arginine decarboxylase [Bacillota bacterium]
MQQPFIRKVASLPLYSNEDIAWLERHKNMPLLHALKDYSKHDIVPFDVPGHKRGRGVPILNEFFGHDLLQMDVNSLPLLDNASHPTGVIKEAQTLLAEAYQADEAFFITNGTTSAIHCMLMSVLEPGDKVLLPRNIHKSAMNGLILCGAIPVYVKTQMTHDGLVGNVEVHDIEEMLNLHPDTKAVFVLNPTYYGYTADLEKIVQICHEKEVLVLVDEAHGAHLPFHEELPKSGMECGADMSCVSIHKTGGALTQASALLINHKRVNAKKVRQVINMLQSTSCSYLLMSSLDGARQNLVLNGRNQLTHVLNLSTMARKRLDNIKGIKVVEAISNQVGQYDITKLGINVSGLGLSGFEVYELMWKQFNIQLEMPDFNHVLAIMSLGDCEEHIERLITAFDIISKHYAKATKSKIIQKIQYVQPKVSVSPRVAYYSDKEAVPLEQAHGRLCGESIMAYPPGIPIIAPGEVMTKEIIHRIQTLKTSGAFMTDSYDRTLEKILVLTNEQEDIKGEI